VLTLLVGLVTVRILATGELRRTSRSGASPQQQLARIRGSMSIPRTYGTILGLLSAGEVLLEAPFLRGAWGLTGALVAFLFRLLATAVWLDAAVTHSERITGRTAPYGTTMAHNLRPVVTQLLPRYAAAGIVVQLVHQGDVTGVQLMIGYIVVTAAVAVLGPLLQRLGRSVREPTSGEAAAIARAAEQHGLDVGPVRVVRDDLGARVAGVGPGARIFVGDRLLAGPEDELAAVLAHEVAHRERHHITWRVGVMTASAVAMVLVAAAIPAAVERGGNILTVVLVAAVVIPVARYVGLAFIRVQQEHSADAWAAGRTSAEALGRFLARHDDGIPLGGRGTWRYHVRSGHPTLAERLAALGVRPAAAR
jgi:Zn-dependent protease with chaperone function